MNDVMFQIVPVFIGLVFLVMLGMIIIWSVKGMGQWKKNNQSPVLTVAATIVAKRMDVTHNVHHHRDGSNGMADPMDSSTHTRYFTTFQVESGDRMEFLVDGREYGILAEGDQGKLTFQGTRYQGFLRNRQ